jgi:NodT family efflux transporter outer membrane factor (OMF) lipoprotein
MNGRRKEAAAARWGIVATSLAIVLASGCTVGPDYVRPSAPVSTEYKEAKGWKLAQPADTLPRGNWWELYGVPELNTLVAQVDAANQNVAVAAARVRQARALTQAARAAYFPVVSGSGFATRSGSSAGGGRVGIDSGGNVSNNFSVALDVSWEVDLWGRVRRTVESSTASAEASVADLESVKLAAQADVVIDYLLLRVQDATIALLNETAAGYERSLQLTRNQFAVGVVGRVDVVQAEAQLAATQAQVLDAGVQRAQLEHAIAVLIGKPPAEFSLPLGAAVQTFPSIPLGIPSELLERRPDIASAERQMAAANAQIGVAEAAYFPSLTLNATGGFQNSLLSDLLSWPSRFWALGPALIAQTIFDAGLRKAQTAQAVAAYDATVATYRQTVLNGFQEVEDNLASLRILEQEAAFQDTAVRAAREAAAITLNQYKAGTANYLAVVVLQNAALNSERTSLGILGRRLSASVNLIKALGGGWNASDIASEPATAKNDASPRS